MSSSLNSNQTRFGQALGYNGNPTNYSGQNYEKKFTIYSTKTKTIFLSPAIPQSEFEETSAS